jgi:diguanylate cyclase (GGDEF)-like protein
MCNVIKALKWLIGVLILVILVFFRQYNYLLFHSIAETFSICIAFTVFMITLNSSRYLDSNFYMMIGITYLFIGIMDFFHMLSYQGMPIFKDYDYYANQMWIGTRYFECLTMLIALIFVGRKKKVSMYLLMGVYAAITAGILMSVFVWKIFPICFVKGIGQTPFKVWSEYVICFLLLLCLLLLQRHRNLFKAEAYRLLRLFILLLVLSEFCFALYTDNYGILSMVGHLLKIAAFYQFYRVIIEMGVKTPYNTVFHELKMSEKALEEQNRKLEVKSNTDGLTGLYNHRHIHERLAAEVELYERNSMQSRLFSIILLDLDRFKSVNDQCGHQIGDKILVWVAERIKSIIRENDIAGRYGGEEFLVLLPETDLEMACNIAERIRMEVENMEAIDYPKITISLGVAQYAGDTVAEVIRRADEKLYIAKGKGRNRVEC